MLGAAGGAAAMSHGAVGGAGRKTAGASPRWSARRGPARRGWCLTAHRSVPQLVAVGAVGVWGSGAGGAAGREQPPPSLPVRAVSPVVRQGCMGQCDGCRSSPARWAHRLQQFCAKLSPGPNPEPWLAAARADAAPRFAQPRQGRPVGQCPVSPSVIDLRLSFFGGMPSRNNTIQITASLCIHKSG